MRVLFLDLHLELVVVLVTKLLNLLCLLSSLFDLLQRPVLLQLQHLNAIVKEEHVLFDLAARL